MIASLTKGTNEMNKNNIYTDQRDGRSHEALVESFVGKEVRITHNSGVTANISFNVTFDGILTSNLDGYYRVAVGDESLEGLGLAEISFNRGSVDAAWRAASGRIIRLHA